MGVMRRPAPERKAEIISTAIALADDVGPDRITTEMIAKTIGVTQATIFRHFPKKEDIWNGVALHLTGKMRATWEEVGKVGGTPVAVLEAVVLAHLQLIEQMPALPAILLSRELHAENAPLRQTLMGAMGSFRELIAGLVEEAKKDGTFRDDLSANDAAMLLIGLIQSLAMRWSLSGKSDDLSKTGRRLLAVQLAGFFSAGQITPTGERSKS